MSDSPFSDDLLLGSLFIFLSLFFFPLDYGTCTVTFFFEVQDDHLVLILSTKGLHETVGWLIVTWFCLLSFSSSISAIDGSNPNYSLCEGVIMLICSNYWLILKLLWGSAYCWRQEDGSDDFMVLTSLLYLGYGSLGGSDLLTRIYRGDRCCSCLVCEEGLLKVKCVELWSCYQPIKWDYLFVPVTTIEGLSYSF